jgi:hypothetical protein
MSVEIAEDMATFRKIHNVVTCFADITEGLYSRVKFFCVVLAEVFNLFAVLRVAARASEMVQTI